MPLSLHCCICKGSLPCEGPQQHPLDPCGLVIIAHFDKGWRDQKEQTFYCHFECFRRLVDDDGALQIMEPGFSTNGEGEDERIEEAASGKENPDAGTASEQPREAVVRHVEVSNDRLTVDLDDGRTIAVPLAWYPRLARGTTAQRASWRLIGGGRGIHWPELDEDISVANLLAGRPSAES